MSGPVTTRYRCPSPAERVLRRIARSPFARDVRSRLHIIPECIGGVAAVYVLFGLIHLAAVAQSLVSR